MYYLYDSIIIINNNKENTETTTYIHTSLHKYIFVTTADKTKKEIIEIIKYLCIIYNVSHR